MSGTAQSPTKTEEPPKDPEVERLLLEKAKAEARKAIAEARRDELKAMMPDLSFEVPQGSLTPPDKASPVAELIGYSVLGDATDGIAAELRQQLTSTDRVDVLLVDDLSLASSDAIYLQVRSQLELFRAKVDALVKALSPPTDQVQLLPAASVAVGAAVSALPGLLSLFKRDVTVLGREFKIGASAVAASMVRSLARNDGWRCYLHGFRPVPHAGVLESVKGLQERRDTLGELRLRHQITEVDAVAPELASKRARLTLRQSDRDALAREKADTTEIDRELDRLTADLATLQARQDEARIVVGAAGTLIEAVDTFLTSLSVTPSGAKYPPIVGAALLEGLHSDEQSSPHYDYVLFVDVAFAGGESMYEQKVGTDRVAHLAGCVVAYLVTDRSGVVVASGTRTEFGLETHKLNAEDFRLVKRVAIERR